MFGQQVKVGQWLKFIGDANKDNNVKGNFSRERVCLDEDFIKKDLDETHFWTEFLDTTSTVTPVATTLFTGAARLTTAATINLCCSLASPLLLYAENNPAVEWEFKIDDISNVI